MALVRDGRREESDELTPCRTPMALRRHRSWWSKGNDKSPPSSRAVPLSGVVVVRVKEAKCDWGVYIVQGDGLVYLFHAHVDFSIFLIVEDIRCQLASSILIATPEGIGPLNPPLQLRMARGKKKASRIRSPPPPSHKLCIYCQVHKVVRTFAKHQKACKRIWQTDHEAHGVNRTIGNDKGHGNETLAEMVNMS